MQAGGSNTNIDIITSYGSNDLGSVYHLHALHGRRCLKILDVCNFRVSANMYNTIISDSVVLFHGKYI